MSQTPLCKTCKHHFTAGIDSRCAHPDEVFSPVNGTPITKCWIARHGATPCGPEGRRYEPGLNIAHQLSICLSRPPEEGGIGSQVNRLTKFVTMNDLLAAIGECKNKATSELEYEIRTEMSRAGWLHQKRLVNGVRSWCYIRPGTPGAEDSAPATATKSMCFLDGMRLNLTCAADAQHAFLQLPIASEWGAKVDVFHPLDADECGELAQALTKAAAHIRAAHESRAK